MFRRSRRSKAAPPSTPEEFVGVVARVMVRSTAESGWVGDPTGVVIAPGNNEMAGYPGLAPGGPVSWLIAFDEPAYRVANAVPYDEATVASRDVSLLPTEP